MNNNVNNVNNDSNNNTSLGLSLSQGQTFSNQQQTRLLNNNNVARNTAGQDKNKANKAKKNKINQNRGTNIEPFVPNLKSDYKTLSMQDIDYNNARIKAVNDNQILQTRNSISSYTDITNNLTNFQRGVTEQAKAYNYVNKNPGLLNRNYLTGDNKNIRVNNKGVVNALNPNNLATRPPSTAGININNSVSNSNADFNYVPVEDIPQGLTEGPDTGLYNQQISSKQISLPNGNSGYNLEGENVFVIYPYPNGIEQVGKNTIYYGAYRSDGLQGLTLDEEMGVDRVSHCLQRAVNQGFSWCGMTSLGWVSDYKRGGWGGKCMIGNVTNFSSPAYLVKTISQTGSSSVLKFPTSGYNSLTFGADGVLYAGYKKILFGHPLTKVFNNELDQSYGGSINNLVGSYAYNQGKWQNLKVFDGNVDPTGAPSGTFNTLYKYDIQVPNTGYTTKYYKSWFGQQIPYQEPYTYYTTQTMEKLAAENKENGNLTYINYNCGKTPTKEPIMLGNQNAGAGYNLDCSELYNKYPSFTLVLSDAGILTITNNTASTEISADSKVVTYDMSYGYPNNVTLQNGQVVLLNMPRADWVNDSINKGAGLVSNSKNIPSMSWGGEGTGKTISSPNGYCRLVLSNNSLYLEYSLQDVTQGADSNLIGNNSSSVALYHIKNVNTSKLGTSAHIDINGEAFPYPAESFGPQGYDNVYTKIEDYIPTYLDPRKFIQGSQKECENACNNSESLCYGYVHAGNFCNIITGSTQIIGNNTINMKPYTDAHTYVRHTKFPGNDNSCRKTLDAVIGTEVYSYYLNNGITPYNPTYMTPQTKCNLGKVLDKQMNELKRRNIAAVEKGNEIKDKFTDVFIRENTILNNISDNKKNSQIYDDNTTKTEEEIKRIKNIQITKSATEKDSELLLVSDNYKYIIWGIVSLLISLATIKGLRMASS